MIKILFIGNSFTYFNDMPSAIFARVAERCGIELEVVSVTKGGWSLSKYADAEDEYGAKVHSLLKSEKFDFVVLQEQSHTPISDKASFHSAVRRLCELICENGAKPYLYATWGYAKEHPKLPIYGPCTGDMERKLRLSYAEIAEELSIPVCQVGCAMTYAYENGMECLYKPDHYHPDVCASLIAALVIFEKIFGIEVDAEGVLPESLSERDAALLNAAVSYAKKE